MVPTEMKSIPAIEIVRTLVGSIGFATAAPIATVVAVAMLKNTVFSGDSTHAPITKRNTPPFGGALLGRTPSNLLILAID